MAAWRNGHGCWGWLEAYRASDGAPFTSEDRQALAACAELLGAALRHRAKRKQPPRGPSPAPAVLIFDADLRATSWTPTANDWIARLPSPRHHAPGQLLPSVVYAVAGRAVDTARRSPARARVATTDGQWATVEGAPLQGARPESVAVTLRLAHPHEILGMTSRIYALTRRERQLAELVSAGLDTSQLAEELAISRHTVKDHLKAVFAKLGVTNRTELAARLTGNTLA